MKTSFLILSLFTVFVTSAPANETKFIQMSILDNDCVFVDMDIDFGALPASEQANYDSYLSFCDGYGPYRIVRNGLENKFVMTLDFNNQEIPLSVDVMTFGQNVAWVFSDKASIDEVPVALIYSTYTDVQVDSVNNVWEPKETQVVVALNGTNSCIVAEVKEDKNSNIDWKKTLDLAHNASKLNCIN